MDENYKPFGEEWEKSLMKMSKKDLIRMHKKVCIAQHATTDKLSKIENPYPEDVFVELSEIEQEAFNEFLEDGGWIPDRVFGSFGRKVFNNAIEAAKTALL